MKQLGVKNIIYVWEAFAIVILFMLNMGILSCKNNPLYPPPLTPAASVKTFQFAEDFEVEVFASEPLVMDPVSMFFNDEGDVFVVEMPDANQPDSAKGESRIIILKDTDGDGRADKRIVFTDGLKNPTSILPWGGGVLVTAAPDILYYKDTDGDGEADLKETIFTGFFNNNEAAQITSLTYGIDNWIYANNMGQPGEVVFNRKPELGKLPLQGADFRFRLDRNQFERSTGPGQFGMAIDDWGHRFITQNSIHIRQVVIPWRYLERNPYMPITERIAVENISDHDPFMYQRSETPHWRQVRTDRRNKEFRDKGLDRTEYAREQFTGASGGIYYGGDAFPEKYYGNIFTGDVAGNLVHRDILHYNDTSLYSIAKRSASEKDKEFLAATDSWFRPVSFCVGPDGFLYVVDMYRQHIEDPVSIPDDLEVDIDFSAGDNYGRIYRIVPSGEFKRKQANANLKTMSTEDLAELLSHPNQWWRNQAQRLIIERKDKSIVPEIISLFYHSENPKCRLHALYVLEGLDALNADIVKWAMKDSSSGVRENAAILSERYPDCLNDLLKMTGDSVARVAFQAILSVGEFRDKKVKDIMPETIEKRAQNPWFRTAILSSKIGSDIEVLIPVVKSMTTDDSQLWKIQFIESASHIIAARNDKREVSRLLEFVSQSEIFSNVTIRTALLKGIISGFEKAEGIEQKVKERLKEMNLESEERLKKDLNDLGSILFDEKTL